MVEPVGNELVITDVPAFADALRYTAHAADGPGGRPALSGIHVKGDGEQVSIAATDGYRLSLAWLPLAWSGEAILPPRFVVELARNFGEHAAVLEGYRHASGEIVVNLDDDLQNPPSEAVKLVRHLRESDAEVVYSRYAKKKHHWARNVASWLANCSATFLLGKPKDLYLSSFRALRRDLMGRIVAYRGPYPYVDGLILGATNRIATLEVEHVERQGGRSGYTLRKLIRLALSLLFDFSVMPLRIASVLGVLLCILGGLILAEVVIETFYVGPRQIGWGSLMGALAVFSGAQLLMLGIIGEYIGRAFLTVSGKPQSLVRTLTAHVKTPSA